MQILLDSFAGAPASNGMKTLKNAAPSLILIVAIILDSYEVNVD